MDILITLVVVWAVGASVTAGILREREDNMNPFGALIGYFLFWIIFLTMAVRKRGR
jgi:hypothetical protein